MHEMFFLSSWPTLDNAWSGTPMGLYTALSKKINLRLLECHKEPGKIKSILNLLSMDLTALPAFEKHLNRVDIPNGVPLFVFGEYLTRHLSSTYCYQDLSVDYLLRLRKQKHPAARYTLYKGTPTCIVNLKKHRAKKFYRNCAGIFTMSAWLRDDLINNSGIPAEKVHHVGGGSNIDVTKIDCGKKCGNRFLFVGKYWDTKNGDLVVAAFDQLCATHPEYKPQLYIAGPSEKPECIKEQENIVFLGQLTFDELIGYYNLCDYYVMPSKHDAYGLVFAEALCFGLPCIGKNTCAMPEFIQDGKNGFLIQNDDTEELAAAMGKLLTDGKAIVNYVQENRDHYITKYSWDSVADRIIQVLKNDGFFKSTT